MSATSLSYVDIEGIESWYNKHPNSEIQNISKFVKTVPLQQESQQNSRFHNPNFSSRYFGIQWQMMENFTPKFTFLFKPIKSLQDNEPFTKLPISENPDFPGRWAPQHWLFSGDNLHILLTRRYENVLLLSFCLAHYHFDSQTKTLNKVIVQEIQCPVVQMVQQPTHRGVDSNQLYFPSHLTTIRGKVFAFTSFNSSKPCYWIHCFSHNKIMTLKQLNDRDTGFAAISHKSRILMRTNDHNEFVCFSIECTLSKSSNSRVFDAHRLFLC